MDAKFKRNLIISSSVSMLILLVSSTASFLSIRNLRDSNALINHTQTVISNLNGVTESLLNAQTSMRGFLITGKEENLERYKGSKAITDSLLQEIKMLTEDNSDAQKAIAEILPINEKYYTYLANNIIEKRLGKVTSPDDLHLGRKYMTEIRYVLKRMEDHEKDLLKDRIEQAENYGLYSTILIIFAAILALFITAVFFVRIYKDYEVRARMQKELLRKDEETAERIAVISGIADQISQGNYDVRAREEEKDALGSVSFSLNHMASSLSKSFNSLSDNEWLQSSVADLNQVMLGEKMPKVLAEDVVNYLAEITESNAAVLYLVDNESLKVASGYCHVADPARDRLKIGEGLSGQAASSGKMLEIKGIANEDIRISYALGEAKPHHIIALPLMDDRISGVVELASMDEFTALDKKFLKSVSANISIAFTAAQNRMRVQELLDETQTQSEELRVQHSELENINAELETQTEKLQASEEELRVQQEELQQTNEELAERSVLLEEKNTEIQKKSEDLELTTRYKSEFLANMSHELRTPLNSILLLSRLLGENNDENMNDEQIEFAKVIQSSGNGLLALIDEILDLSKIEAGKMDLELIDTPVSDISETMTNLFSALAKEKKIDFKVITTDAPLVIKTDKMRIEQILKNLISNAIKFTSEGSVSLEIKKNPNDNKIVSFVVKDTGIGIPREKQPLVFEAFRQADGSTKRKYGGTGLGLSISRELAKLLKGEISVKSKVGEGSEFTLNVPITGSIGSAASIYRESVINVDSNHEQDEVMEDDIPQLSIRPKPYLSEFIPDDIPDDRDDLQEGDKIILIVEDDVNFAKSLLEFTRRRGYKGITTVRGDQALNLALLHKPVGVLLDVQLPIMSGWEVIDELKNNPQTRHIPVHMMSSHKLRQESLLKGAINFLEKPVAFEQMPSIFKRIENMISKDAKKVMILEDNPKHAKALAFFLETYNISSEIKSDIQEGVDALKNENVDCVILDMGVPDKHAYEILENVKKNKEYANLPVIVFTGKSLSIREELKIKKYADSIVVKTAHSYQRMLDEVSLFMHLVEDKTTKGRKQNMLTNVLNGKKVLVVDDDVRNIYSLTKALETLKMDVITAIDGQEALNVLDKNPDIDVVLLDMMMPNMDGYETAGKIREDKRFRKLPVIAVTAKAMTGDRDKCINAGASDYITKPVDIDQLLSLLRVWLYDSI